MDWLGVLGVALLVAAILWLMTRQFKPKVVLGGAPESRVHVGPEPAPEGLSSVLQGSLRRVGEAVDRCSTAQGNDQAVARRVLAGALREGVTELAALARDTPPDSRIRDMVRLTTEELWQNARPWLILKEIVVARSMTTVEVSELQRSLWSHAEEVIAASVKARGDEVVAARERLLQLIDENKAFSASLDGTTMSEGQAAMWRLAEEEIIAFASDGLARLDGP